MVSRQTLNEMLRVLRMHVPDVDARDRLLVDLARVPGNRSFADTMAGLRELDAGGGRAPDEARVPEAPDPELAALMLPPLSEVLTSHIPPELREWTVRVYRIDHSGHRSPNEALARTFTEDRARDFFQRTQNVWNARARGGEAPAFHVVLGVQDARKHRKKASYRELTVAVCDGKGLQD